MKGGSSKHANGHLVSKSKEVPRKTMLQTLMLWIYKNAVEGTRSSELLAAVLTADNGMIPFLSLIARETGVHIIVFTEHGDIFRSRHTSVKIVSFYDVVGSHGNMPERRKCCCVCAYRSLCVISMTACLAFILTYVCVDVCVSSVCAASMLRVFVDVCRECVFEICIYRTYNVIYMYIKAYVISE